MRRTLRWFGSAKGKGAGFSFLSLGNVLMALITYLRFAEIARVFGTTWETDAVAVAMVIPMLLQQLISTAFGAAFLPIYSRVRAERGFSRANLLVSRIINWMTLSGLILIGLVVASGTLTVRIVGPGADPRIIQLAARILYVFLPLVLLNAIEGILQNFLIYGRRYGLVSFVRVLQILVSYLVLLWGHPMLGIMIIPVSGLAGALVSFAACSFMTLLFKLRHYPSFDPRDRDFRELVRLALPITVGVVTGFLGPVADKVLASFLRTSSITAIDYAGRIKNLVSMVLIQPIVVLCTVSFSKTAAEGRIEDLKREISSFIMNISYYAVPVAGILTVMAVPLTSVFFQRGEFGPDESRMVGHALAFYSPVFAQLGISLIISNAFFSLKESVTPVVLGIWGVFCNIMLNVILIGPLGIRGLALATTLTSAAKTLLLMYYLRKRLGGIDAGRFLPEYLKILAGTGLMVFFMVLTGRLLPIDIHAALGARFLRLAVITVPGISIYVVSTALMGSRTFRRFSDIFKGKLFGAGTPPHDGNGQQ